MQQKRFDATLMHTHTFPLEDVPTAFRYCRDRIEDAIKVVVKMNHSVPASAPAGEVTCGCER
jgi:L-iditol 2-dehydrogenase